MLAPTADLRPYGVFGDRTITMWDYHGYSIYHALQTQVRSRFGRSRLQGSYTWSRTISNDPLDNTVGGNLTDLDSPSLDRGLAGTHRTHVFNRSLVLFLPSPQTRSRFVRQLLGDWEVATIASAASGTPVTIVTSVIPGLNGGVSGSGRFFQRPNRVAGESCRPRGGTPEQSINPAAFTLADFQIGSPGNSAAGVCEGPGMFQTDLALYKNISTTSKVRLQLRFEVFNVFNRTNFIFVVIRHGRRRRRDDDHELRAAGKLRPGPGGARSAAGADRHQGDILNGFTTTVQRERIQLVIASTAR